MDRVTVFTAFNPVAAQIVWSRLQTAGFDASVEREAAALNMEGYSLAAFVFRFLEMRKLMREI